MLVLVLAHCRACGHGAGQPTQSESVTVDDWDRLTRRFAALQTEKIAQIGVQHKAHGSIDLAPRVV